MPVYHFTNGPYQSITTQLDHICLSLHSWIMLAYYYTVRSCKSIYAQLDHLSHDEATPGRIHRLSEHK